MEDGKIGAPDKVSVASKKPKIKRKRMIDQSEIWEHFDMVMTEYSIRATYPTKTAVTSGLFCHKFDPDGLRKALSFMLIVDQLPYKFVEGEGFRFFCNMMDPRFQVPSWQTVARDCFEMYLVEKKRLKSVLKNCNSRVCLTTDAWTSIQQINYMCLTAHFIDNDWKLQKKILNFCSVTSHKGEEVGKMIEKCLLEWEIDNILAITVDNASKYSKDETQSLSTQKKVEALKTKYRKQKCERKGESKMELDKYLDEETEEDFEEFDILGWWKLNGQRFPTMKRIARDVLAYPISTVASESAFSTGGRVLDTFRSSLSPKVVESLICTQDWLRASSYGVNVEECLEEVEQLEQDLLNMKLPEDEPVPAIEIED